MADAKTRRSFVLALICAAELMMVLDFSIVTVALPDIEQALNFSQEILQWVVSAYALAFGGFLLLGGRSADLFGRRRVFALGLVLFTLASLAGGLAGSRSMLLTARAVQGMGAALVSPSALSILIVTFPEGKERNYALTIWGAMAAGGIAAGVLLGGLVVNLLSWRWVFFVNVPVGILTLVGIPLLLQQSHDQKASQKMDWAGAITITLGLVGMVYTLERVGSVGLRSVQLAIAFGIALLSLIAFVVIEQKSAAPLVPLTIFRRRSILAGTLLGALMNAALGASVIILTLYMQKVLKYSPLQAGLSFLPIAIVAVLTAPFAAKLVARFGSRYTLAGSITLVAIGLFALSRVPVQGHFFSDLLPGGVAIGLGIVVTQVAISITATRGVSDREEGLVSGLLTTSQQTGSALGLAVLVAVAAIRTKVVASSASAESLAALTAGYRAALLVGAGFALIGVVVALLVIKKGVNR